MSIEHQKEILNKIKHKEPLSKNEIVDILFKYGIYDEKDAHNGWYNYISTISKLNDTYVVTDWKNGLNEYEYPIIVTEVKTKEIRLYKYFIYLDDNTTFITTNLNSQLFI